MTQEIYVGFDCCKDYKNPTRTPRIYPRNITMNVGEVINLYLMTVHPECYKSCYTWKILNGGGFLEPEKGIETIYHAPSTNENCLSSPTIQVVCPRGSLDTIDIAVLGLPKPLSAYLKLLEWKKSIPIIKDLMIRIDPTPYYHPDMKPEYYSMNVDMYACDRSRLRRTYVGLIQRVRYVWGKPTLDKNVWLPLAAPGAPILYYGLYISGDAKTAQGELLQICRTYGLFGRLAPTPTYYKDIRPVFVAPVPTTFIPPQTIDIRKTWQRIEGCCVHDLIGV